MRERPEGVPEELSRRVGGGVGKGVSEKAFIDLVASTLTQGSSESLSGGQTQEGCRRQKRQTEVQELGQI